MIGDHQKKAEVFTMQKKILSQKKAIVAKQVGTRRYIKCYRKGKQSEG